MFKLHNTKYLHSISPRDAMNEDVNRNCTTFDSVAALSASYHALCGKLGRPLYVRNTHGKILELEKGEFIPRSVDAIFGTLRVYMCVYVGVQLCMQRGDVCTAAESRVSPIYFWNALYLKGMAELYFPFTFC